MTENQPTKYKPSGQSRPNHNANFRRNDQAPRKGQRPDGAHDQRVRGTARQMIERYEALAREATISGDTAQMHHYLQHAEHYIRVLGLQEADPEGQC